MLISNAAVVFPAQQPHLNPSDLCPLVKIVEHELCVNQHSATLHATNANNASDLCVLLHNYNTSFCSGGKGQLDTNTKPISYDVMSVRVLEHEFHAANRVHEVKDIHQVCPIINFIEQELCTSRNEELQIRFDPKELCPLLNLTYTEFCE
jgi:hypothetical protein